MGGRGTADGTPRSGAHPDLEDLLRAWDGEALVLRCDRPTGAWFVVALHSTALGPAGGGTRMRSYPGLAAAAADAMRLASGMTRKLAVAGLPFGGGKAVIAVPPGLASGERAGLLRRYGALVRTLGGRFYTAPDVGTSPADMDVIGETGSPYVFGRTEEAGGSGGSAPPTALGVLAAIEATWEHLTGSDELRGVRVLVQGAGGVGGGLIERLVQAGAEVRFSDVDPETVSRIRGAHGLAYVAPDGVPDTECDVYAPCALGGVLNAETIPRLRCRAVVGAANNQLATPEDGERLRARGILYVPDFVANAGGAMAIVGLELLGWSRPEMEARVRGIKQVVREVLADAASEGIPTEAAALRLAEARLAGGATPSA